VTAVVWRVASAAVHGCPHGRPHGISEVGWKILCLGDFFSDDSSKFWAGFRSCASSTAIIFYIDGSRATARRGWLLAEGMMRNSGTALLKPSR
jgi:hypothetical protein